MNRAQFKREFRSYLSIFVFFSIIFVFFESNMSFAESACDRIKSRTTLEQCRPNLFTVEGVDADGNRPINCNDFSEDYYSYDGITTQGSKIKNNKVSLNYAPYKTPDYYYDKNNGGIFLCS